MTIRTNILKRWSPGRALLLLIAAVTLSNEVTAQSMPATITGTIVDTAGAPIAGLRIVVTSAPGAKTLNTLTARADELGRYRITVAPGNYTIKVGAGCGETSILQDCPLDAPIYIYHPATESRSNATVVSVAAGGVREGMNFVLDRDTVNRLQAEGKRLLSMAYDLWKLGTQPVKTTTWKSTVEMHDFFVASFIATPGMGSGRMGAMRLQFDPQQRLELPDDAWMISELELIGIAKHDQPVVFTRIGHGTGESERSLNDFEGQALTALRSGKNIVSRRSVDGMLLVGAIRARSTCVRCHKSQREGDLLGAFRYVLQKAPATGG